MYFKNTHHYTRFKDATLNRACVAQTSHNGAVIMFVMLMKVRNDGLQQQAESEHFHQNTPTT
jgi:hypothetical protein